MALADAGGAADAEVRRQWMKSAARLIRFAFLLETDGIQYSPALAALGSWSAEEHRTVLYDAALTGAELLGAGERDA